MGKPLTPKKSTGRAARATQGDVLGGSEADDTLPAILEDLAERCRLLEAECNPEGGNLHFGPQVHASPAVLAALYDIGTPAWRAVENHQSGRALFWFYDWFLLVANVSLQIWRDNTQEEYADAPVTQLALLLVEISQMTVQEKYPGDIQKRHYEALAHVLLAFGKSHRLVGIVTARAKETMNEHVIGFVRGTIGAVQRIEREAQKSRADAAR